MIEFMSKKISKRCDKYVEFIFVKIILKIDMKEILFFKIYILDRIFIIIRIFILLGVYFYNIVVCL